MILVVMGLLKGRDHVWVYFYFFSKYVYACKNMKHLYGYSNIGTYIILF